MASTCTRRTLRFSTSSSLRTAMSNISKNKASAKSLGTSTASAGLPGFSAAPKSSSNSRFSLRRLLTTSRSPVELGGALSLMPLHSVTASALSTSLLSLHSVNWGCLSEGFATPL